MRCRIRIVICFWLNSAFFMSSAWKNLLGYLSCKQMESCVILSLKTKNKTKTIWNRMTGSVLKQDPKRKRFKRTPIYYDTDTQYAIFRGNLSQATKRHLTVKWSKTMKNDKEAYLFLVDLLSLVQYLEDCSNWQQINQKKICFFLIFPLSWPFNCCLSVVLWLDEGDFPRNLHIVCPCHNK